MAEKFRFFNSTTEDPRKYGAAELAEVFSTFFSNGVISGLKVSKTSSGVSVDTGYAMVNGYWYHLDVAKTLSTTSNTAPYTGMVVIKLDLNARNITLVYKTNTTLTNSDNICEISLAKVSMAANSTTPTSVTDYRTISKVQAEANISAADVIEKLLTVDGAGSELNADMLDGQHGSYYRNYANLTNKPTIPSVLYGTSAPSDSSGTNGSIYIQY